jgi:RHS repeat-associated protein
MGIRGVVAGLVSGVLVVAGSGVPALSAEDPDTEWKGPFAAQEAPVAERVTPRKAADLELDRPALTPGSEVVAERTERSKTFVGDQEGMFETRLFAEPVHARAGDAWVEIDTDLVNGEDGRWEPEASGVEVSMAGDGAQADLVRVELGQGRSLGWGVQGAAQEPEATSPDPGLGLARSNAARGKAKGATVAYPDVLPGTGVEVTATPTGVKEDLVLADAKAPAVFFFDLDLDGLSAVEAGDGVHFLDDAGQVVAAVPAGFMVDAAGVVSEDVRMDLVGPANDPVLKVRIDKSWLTAKDRAFPVRVDPTVNLTAGVADTHVESTRPTTNFSGYTFMRVGKDSSGRVARGFIRFDLSSLSGKTIDYAQLNLNNRVSADCTPRTVAVHAVTQAWTASSVAFPGPGYGDKVGDVSIGAGASGCSEAPARIWVSQAVRDWASGDLANHGFALLGNEADASSMKLLDTTEVADAAKRPYLRVSWRDSLLGNLGYYTMNTATLTDRAQMSVNVANGNLHLSNTDVSLPGVAGTGLNVSRYYNSREDAITPARAGQTGTGWTLDVGPDVRLSINGYDNAAYFEGPTGYRVVFPYDRVAQEWSKPAGLNATLEKPTNDDDYVLTMVETGMRYHFNDGPALDVIEDQRGNTITMGYTGSRLTSITDTLSGTTTLAHNADGFVTSITDPDGRKVSYTYAGRNLATVTDQTGATTSYAYDANANLTSITDPNGGTTRYVYNADDELVSVTWADSTTASPKVTTYDRLSGNRVQVTDPNGGDYWSYHFDSQGRLETFYSPRSGVGEEYAYDVNNSVTTYTNSTGGLGTLSYDGYNVESIQSANGATSTFEYNSPNTGDRPSKYTNAQGVALDYQWKNSQEMTQVKQNNVVMAEMTYRSASQSCSGSLAQATDGRGQVTTYTYDSRCRMTKVDRPAPMGDTTMTYDAFDRVRTVTDGRGAKQTISYDANDRVTSIVYTRTGVTGTDKVDYTYDGNGNRTTRVDTVPGAGPKTSTWALDARNRVTSEVLPEGSNTYTYDKSGNLASLTNAWGTTSYTYDDENDVKTITPPVGDPITFDYYEHTYAAVKFPNDVTDAQHYDTDGRIQTIDQYFYDPNLPAGNYRKYTQWDYDYNGTDSIYSITDTEYDYSLDYTYDTNGRIASSYGVSAGDIFEENSYTYDANSNRTGWTLGSRGSTWDYTASYNNADQLTSVSKDGGAATTYTYDQAGNQTSNSVGAAATYDTRGRATQLEHEYSNRGSETATYNGTSQVERTSIGGWTFTNSLLGITSSTQAAEGTRHYVYAPDGRVLAEYRAKDNTWRYYLTNHQGSITGGTDTTGHRTESYGYGPYGEYTYGSGGGTDLIHWRYTGEWLDGTSVTGDGYYKIGLRYYDDTLGRWTQTDPAERATNPLQPAEAQPYNYSGCNPVNQTDPTGACSTPWAVIGTLGGLGSLGFGGYGLVGVLLYGSAFALGPVGLIGTGVSLVAGTAGLIACPPYE